MWQGNISFLMCKAVIDGLELRLNWNWTN